MKFSTNREGLLRSLQLVTGVVERRQTLPVLANLLVVARDGVLSLTGTDLEVELVARDEGVDIEQDGEVTIPARKLADIWRSLPEGAQVTVQAFDNNCESNCTTPIASIVLGGTDDMRNPTFDESVACAGLSAGQCDVLRDEFHNPNLINPNLINPNLINPNLINPNLINPNLINPNLINPNLINPNLIAPAAPETGAITDVRVCRALARLVKEIGATPVIAESSAIGCETASYRDLSRDFGIDPMDQIRPVHLRADSEDKNGTKIWPVQRAANFLA